MSSINQIQMSYVPEEDRVLLRMNTSGGDEFRFWLTRRYSGLLGQVLALHRQADPDVSMQVSESDRQAVEQFKQEAANAQANFQDGFQSSGRYPLGEQPLLAFKLQYEVVEGKLVLTIEPKTGQGITVTLDQQLNFNVSRLLKTAAHKAKWALDLDSQVDLPANAQQRVVN